MATKNRKPTKATGDRVAHTASHLLRTSRNAKVLSVAGSALSQAQPAAPPRRPRRPRARFKAGKDLVEDG